MSMRIYISGPITGIAEANKPAFAAAAAQLAERYPDATIVNPHDKGLPADSSWDTHMRADIKLLMDCDAVAVLDGWEISKGARIEIELAERLRMRVYALSEWLKLARADEVAGDAEAARL